MKVALCLSGQPRVVDVGFHKLSQSILQHNSDVDVFIHTWFDPENLSTIQSYLEEKVINWIQMQLIS